MEINYRVDYESRNLCAARGAKKTLKQFCTIGSILIIYKIYFKYLPIRDLKKKNFSIYSLKIKKNIYLLVCKYKL